MEQTSGLRAGKIWLMIGRIAVGLLFIVAAFAKMKPQTGMPWTIASVKTSLAMFAMGVDSYQMLPPSAVSFVGTYLPVFELFLGLWLITGIALRLSSLVSTLAICAFIFAMFSAWHRGLTISCGCFGPGEKVSLWSMARDGFLFLPPSLAVMIGAFLAHRKHRAGASPSAVPGTQVAAP